MQKIHITTLGCDKNTIDSQLMAGLLKEGQRELVDDPGEAQIIIVNTCCFIQEAKEESIDYILEYVKLKVEGLCETLIVAGCMAQRYHKELAEEIPEIDGFLGVGHFDQILELIDNRQRENSFLDENSSDYSQGIFRDIDEGIKTAYVRISEGCDHGCTYCIIPAIRGKYRSRKKTAIFEELAYLEKKGITEIILIGQDIAPYGKDLDEKTTLPLLLREMAETFSFKWIRMLYLYPEGVTNDLMEVIKAYPSICQYFDIPLQHTETEVLRRMGRNMNTQEIERILKKIRTTLPDAVIRTTLISGFPGETKDQHQALLKRIQELKFDHLGAFRYSREEGTPAATFENQVDEAEKEKRFEEIMITQQEISKNMKERFLNKKFDVLIEEQEENAYYGRFYGFAPDIDGLVIIDSPEKKLEVGEMVPVRIIHTLEYDLIGEVEDEFTE